MKKGLFTGIIIFIAALLSFPFAFGRIDREREKVVITEEAIFGDPVWAKGVTLEYLTHWNRFALWDTKYTIGTGKTETSFIFEEDGVTWPRAGLEYFDFDVHMNFGTVMDGSGSVHAVNVCDMWMSEVLEDVAGRTKAGEKHTEEVCLKDYYEYVPIELSALSDERQVNSYRNEENDFALVFKIPTKESDKMLVSITKNQHGAITVVDCSRSGGGVCVDTTFDYGAKGCLFTVVCSDFETGERQDLGENSGLFYMPYIKETKYGSTILDSEKIKKVCEVPEGEVPVNLIWDEEEKKVYLASKGKETYHLSVYDVNGAVLEMNQELTVLEKSASMERLPYWGAMTLEDNGIFLKWRDGSFSYVTIENGDYALWCSNRFVPSGALQNELEEGVALPVKIESFDGERLVLGCYEDRNSINMTVAVYNRQEQLYCGNYHHSGEVDRYLRGVGGYVVPQGSYAGN